MYTRSVDGLNGVLKNIDPENHVAAKRSALRMVEPYAGMDVPTLSPCAPGQSFRLQKSQFVNTRGTPGVQVPPQAHLSCAVGGGEKRKKEYIIDVVSLIKYRYVK